MKTTINEDSFVQLCLGIQAQRQRILQLRDPLAGGSGVAAHQIAHQLSNVARILGAPRIRHLIADEVGLGKTIQALMIINALRLQDPQLRVQIVMPDGLMTQWRDELLTRGHRAPTAKLDADEGSLGEDNIQILWPTKLGGKLSEISAQHADLLIVDELHRLSQDLQDRISAQSADYLGVLLLTATPRVQDSARACQLFHILEPERMACAVESLRVERGAEELAAKAWLWPAEERALLLERFDATERAVHHALLGGDGWELLGGEPPLPQAVSAALAHCVQRQIIRTERAGYQDLFPHREHHVHQVEPLRAEEARQRLALEYLRARAALPSGDLRPDAFMQRVLLSPLSLQMRAAELRQRGQDVDGILREIETLCAAEVGDSKLDELLDTLAELWRADPSAQALIVARDNITVSHLAKVIPARLSPLVWFDDADEERSRPLEIAQLMNQQPGPDDLHAHGSVPEQELKRFINKEALVLIAAETGQVGLNLQHARIIILYSIPWSPQQVEQWIGRLDRIGNTATQAEDGSFMPLEVHTITQRGLRDDQIAAVLQRYRVFERSVSVDGAHIGGVEAQIQQLALSGEGSLVREEQVAPAEEPWISTPLSASLPWGPAHARALARRADSLVELTLSPCKVPTRLGRTRREAELKQMLAMFDAAGEYDVKSRFDTERPELRYKTLWYTYRDGGKRMELRSAEPLTDGLTGEPMAPSAKRGAGAFLYKRSRLEQPPALRVSFEDIHKRLQFFDYGGRLYEALVSAWSNRLELQGNVFELALGPDNPLHGRSKYRGDYLITLACADPASALAARADAPWRSIAELTKAWRAELQRVEFDAYKADVRWARQCLPPQLLVLVERFVDGRVGETITDEELVSALLVPWHPETSAFTAKTLKALDGRVGAERRIDADEAESLNKQFNKLYADQLKAQLDSLRRRAARGWRDAYDTFEESYLQRCYVLRADHEAARDARSYALAAAVRRLDEAVDQGVKTRYSREITELLAAHDALTAIEDARLARLEQLAASVKLPRVNPLKSFVIRLA